MDKPTDTPGRRTGPLAGHGDEFFALLTVLGEFKANRLGGEPSDRALAQVAGVSATTIGDWLRGRRFPQDISKVLAVVGAIRAVADARAITGRDSEVAALLDERRWRAAHQAEAWRRAIAIDQTGERAEATPEAASDEFFALLTALGMFRAGPLAGQPPNWVLARAVGVAESTISDWLRGRVFPQDVAQVLDVVRALRAAAADRGIPETASEMAGLLDTRRWRTAYRAEAQRRAGVVSQAVQRAQAASVLTGPPAGRPLSEVRDPFALEVHRSVQADGPQDTLPALPVYVPREHDAELERVVVTAAGGRSRIAVLVGGSSTGKTRACWEVLRLLRDQAQPWRLWHPIDPSRPDALLRELPVVGPRTVVWLNEAQFYLDVPDGLGEQVAAGLRELVRDPARGPVLVLATILPAFWDALTTRPEVGADPHAQVRDLLTGHDITVAAAFTSSQMQHLTQMGDPRLAAAAVTAQDRQVTQFLAGAPELLARYRNAPPPAKALIHAAMDGRRLGMRPSLPHAFLETTGSGYLTDSDWNQLPDDWLEQALAYTSAPCKGVGGPLTRIRVRPPVGPSPADDSRPVYRLADYLDQIGRRTRGDQVPSPVFWAAAMAYAHPGDLTRLGDAARVRGLSRDADQLYRHAASRNPVDDPSAVAELLNALREAGAQEQLATLLAREPAGHVAVDDPSAVAELLNALREAGAQEQFSLLAGRAAEHVSLDDSGGVAKLLDALHRVGTHDRLVVVLAGRAAEHVSLDDSGGVAWLLEALARTGTSEQIMILAGRAATHARLDDSGGVAKLLDALRRAGADEQVTTLVERAAATAAAHAPLVRAHPPRDQMAEPLAMRHSPSRRELILRAAVELLAEGGPRAVTHRAVAARAGVPQASTTYYFESIQQLTDEALRLDLSERKDELQAMIAQVTDKGQSTEQIVRQLTESLITRSQEVTIAQFEVYMQAARNPELRTHADETLAVFEQLIESVLAFLGAREPERAAPVFTALIDGFLLRRVALPGNERADAAALFEAMRALFIAYVMDETEFEQRRERHNRVFVEGSTSLASRVSSDPTVG